MNKFFLGDNLDVMRKFIRDETVDLCYFAPRSIPNVGYNQIYNNIGTEDRAQAQAITDTWTWDDHGNQCYEKILFNKNGVPTPKSLRKRQKSSILTPEIGLLSGMILDNTRNMGIERNRPS